MPKLVLPCSAAHRNPSQFLSQASNSKPSPWELMRWQQQHLSLCDNNVSIGEQGPDLCHKKPDSHAWGRKWKTQTSREYLHGRICQKRCGWPSNTGGNLIKGITHGSFIWIMKRTATSATGEGFFKRQLWVCSCNMIFHIKFSSW